MGRGTTNWPIGAVRGACLDLDTDRSLPRGARIGHQRNPREIVTLEELAISNSFETAALIEVLEEKGLLTKAEVLKMVKRLKAKQAIGIERPW